ncbi:FAD-dependent oxidoreductase [Parvibaculum sp.]|uniref:FAD-dependent oxidoreductase n=1 Tax=Parvibaculum sp. TaxID=2024848 RepID=UPI001B15CB1C|nr:FAD-dependent oxidoreductase [Parvibaculum sp.]MBO6635260.1 FAD-dependent oxidoreductase [Parvibaculum sp.]MBO6679822.1 FAD-dependent oxidoreductase [Parvibaculum sp.]MBO6683817.1 FAD-dependent oxidoreductase [Parvibaculum sp.]MBO6905750.1 FAD-dependent oxidoreductase [Parvibaculum sp.]
MGERILVVGGGIAGLWTALALARSGRELTVLERDPPPPETSADEAFENWERKGVGHLRHSHAFLARLHILIRDNYPDLMEELREAGCRELKFADGLPISLQDTYEPVPADRDMTILTSRRTTLEFIMRRYAARQQGIRFETGALVRDVLTDKDENGALRVTGLTVEQHGETTDWTADIVVDAAGKNSQIIEWLNKAGAGIAEETERAGILYFTRHYRLHDPKNEPARTKVPGAGDLGFIKYGLFPADNGCFSITLAVPEIEMEMRRTIVRPENFDAICAMLPGIATWTSTVASKPVSRVFGMGELISRWRHMTKDGEPRVLNFFPIGDSVIRTNPLYGRGCSFAGVAAEALRETLDRSEDSRERARFYHARLAKDLRQHYDDMVKQDLAAIKRAKNALNPDYKPGVKARLFKSFAEDALLPAVRGDVDLMRSFMRSFHMVDPPNTWARDPRNISKVLVTWARGRKRNADLYPPKLGPGRDEMFASLGISAEADRQRAKSA